MCKEKDSSSFFDELAVLNKKVKEALDKINQEEIPPGRHPSK
jgi:hypothetical protein